MEKHLSNKARMIRVQEVIEDLGLKKCQDTKIGVPGKLLLLNLDVIYKGEKGSLVAKADSDSQVTLSYIVKHKFEFALITCYYKSVKMGIGVKAFLIEIPIQYWLIENGFQV